MRSERLGLGALVAALALGGCSYEWDALRPGPDSGIAVDLGAPRDAVADVAADSGARDAAADALGACPHELREVARVHREAAGAVEVHRLHQPHEALVDIEDSHVAAEAARQRDGGEARLAAFTHGACPRSRGRSAPCRRGVLRSGWQSRGACG